MPDYDLDKLGWYEFERLVQALLKANLSLAIESWGGRGDWGRDAYFEGDLKFPGNVVQSGPFLFQCKFVEEANAAGAKAGPLVLKAVNQEIRKIAERNPGDKSEASTWKGAWGIPPSVYTFITNAPLTSEPRF